MSIRELLVSGTGLALLLFYMLLERRWINRIVRYIPFKICVTGTRGKSSVTRFIASALREAGFSVMARTTGSKPVIIYPQGEEREIKRRGSPSILEGKKVLRKAAKLRIEALVLEMMSIRPECSTVESVRMINPNILVITNVRPDHEAQMGSSVEEISACFARAIPRRCAVFVPEEEFYQVFQEKAGKMDARLFQVPEGIYERILRSAKDLPGLTFEQNLRLALAVTEFMGIDMEVALRGIARARPDFGSLKLWRADLGSPVDCWYLVSLFAANDPQSARKALVKLQEKKLFKGKRVIGLLNLRQDRGDRTIQWMKSLDAGAFPEFQKIYFIGPHAHASRKRLKVWPKDSLVVLPSQKPQSIMERISSMEKKGAVLVGLGNIAGVGRDLVDYWERIGRPYDI